MKKESVRLLDAHRRALAAFQAAHTGFVEVAAKINRL